MKIVLAGAHGVGKTSFAKALAKKLKLNYIHDIVREEAVLKGFTINENTPSIIQLWLLTRQWELETITAEDWIADKCLYDYLVYGEIVLKNDNLKQIIRKEVLANAHYDIVFYLPIEFPMESDGIRSNDENFRIKIDDQYKNFLKKQRIQYSTLTGSIKERVQQALKSLKH